MAKGPAKQVEEEEENIDVEEDEQSDEEDDRNTFQALYTGKYVRLCYFHSLYYLLYHLIVRTKKVKMRMMTTKRKTAMKRMEISKKMEKEGMTMVEMTMKIMRRVMRRERATTMKDQVMMMTRKMMNPLLLQANERLKKMGMERMPSRRRTKLPL